MEAQLEKPAGCFPLAQARNSQVEALDFLWEAMCNGYDDIVIAAPTGAGKTGTGAALCLWAGGLSVAGHDSGGYYLVTQKMLQDQLERDFPRFLPAFFNRGASLKSAH